MDAPPGGTQFTLEPVRSCGVEVKMGRGFVVMLVALYATLYAASAFFARPPQSATASSLPESAPAYSDATTSPAAPAPAGTCSVPQEMAMTIGSYGQVTGTGAAGLRVRSGPATSFATRVILYEEAAVRVKRGPQRDERGALWYELADPRGDEVWGWGSSEYVRAATPCQTASLTLRPAVQARVLSVQLTAYTYQIPGEGAHGTLTRSGSPAAWGTVAVDPSLIPMGSRLAIDGYSDLFVAADTGHGVQGAHVDVFFPDTASALQFGVQHREIMVYQRIV
jgi:3D (Asp-Asp-Asp) domain-containing protein